ncbi:MAG: hypothetical protein WA210_16950 [Burkholderiaceae bacterium]
MKVIDPFMQPKSRGPGRRVGATRSRQFSVQMGSTGPEGEAAVRAMVELGRRQKVGKRLGAAAVIKAERR